MQTIPKQTNRKSATKLLIVQWSRFQNVCVDLNGSVLFTGVNGSGKTTILDAVTYLLTGNTQFNRAAKDRDRTVGGYVRGDTKSNGSSRYLRTGEVISYLAMEFYDPAERAPFVVGVCIESPNETAKPNSSWFVCRGISMDQIRFTEKENGRLKVYPKNELRVGGKYLKASAFLGRDKGTEQVLRALGLRCGVSKYRTKLLKMMAFNPENNIDQFIQGCVLEPGKVGSLKELREQKQQFEHMKELYDSLQQGRKQLETVEKRAVEYEAKKRQLEVRDLMLCYQELCGLEEEKKKISGQSDVLKGMLADLKKQQIRLEAAQQAAQERLRAAESSDLGGMRESLVSLERQLDALERENAAWSAHLAKVKELEKKLKNLLKLAGDDLAVSEDNQRYLGELSGTAVGLSEKMRAFQQIEEAVRAQNPVYEETQIHLQDAIREREQELAVLAGQIRQLEANIMVYPPEAEEARQVIRQELKKQGIDTGVYLFAELVQEITDQSWRKAVETFLGKKRFYIIVDGQYCEKAMEILQNRKLYGAQVVITDKLPQTEIVSGSAAEVLKIPNISARRYANYLLNGIHLCKTIAELHAYPKGGMMKNGMLTKSYSASMMNLTKTRLCLGSDAVRIQLKQAKEEQSRLEQLQETDKTELAAVKERRRATAEIDWNREHYEFGAAQELMECIEKQSHLQKERDAIRNNPDFMTLLNEQNAAREQAQKANQDVIANSEKIGGCSRAIENCSGELERTAERLAGIRRDYELRGKMDPDRKKEMLEEYEKLHRKKPDSWNVITAKTVDNLRGELKECEKRLEDAQMEYCRIAETDINRRGVGYISYYRDEYKNVEHVKIEDAQQKLEIQSKKLESAFMNDFVAEIDESVREAKQEMDAINRELKQIPFGSDTYRFVMNEKADRGTFFRICRRLKNYMDSPEVYMNSGRDDEEMEHDIREFMDRILQEEDEEEYTDYRRYFTYDMEIISRQGGEEVTANLSRKQGSASNGEKQTPYFIILAASLLQCYPANTCCARLAFIDEAFSALSRERIEQMVRYLEDNQFQVFYAAPPEKISSIGTFIPSTVSLICTGRYTDALEGLVKL